MICIHSNESAFSTLCVNEVLELLKNQSLSTEWNGDFSTIPANPGVWAFLANSAKFINQMELLCLPEIDEHMKNYQPVRNLVYLGFSDNIRRDVEKEFNLQVEAEFLRTLGATLGLFPVAGQLINNNSGFFNFSGHDLQILNSFIKTHFKLLWLELDTENFEIELLRRCKPVFNVTANPHPCLKVRKSLELCRGIAAKMPDYELCPKLNVLKLEFLDIDRVLFKASLDFAKMEAGCCLYGNEYPAKPMDYLAFSRVKAIIAESQLHKWKEDYEHLTLDSRTWSVELNTDDSTVMSFGSKSTDDTQDKVKALNDIAFIISKRRFYW